MFNQNSQLRQLVIPTDELRVRVRQDVSEKNHSKVSESVVDLTQKKIRFNGSSIQDVLESLKVPSKDFAGVDSDIDFAKNEAVRLVAEFNCKKQNEAKKVFNKRTFLTNARLARIQAKELFDNFNLVEDNKTATKKLETKVWFDATSAVHAWEGQPVGNGQFIRNVVQVNKESNS